MSVSLYPQTPYWLVGACVLLILGCMLMVNFLPEDERNEIKSGLGPANMTIEEISEAWGVTPNGVFSILFLFLFNNIISLLLLGIVITTTNKEETP